MPLVRITCTPGPSLPACPACGCRSGDRAGQEPRSRCCAAMVTLPGTTRAVPGTKGCTLSPGGRAWKAGR